MLDLRVLGALELTDAEGRPVSALLAQPKRVALLTYLTLAGSRAFHRRDTLLGLFWPDHDSNHARAALRQALSFLRRQLGDDLLETRGPEEVGVSAGQVRCDVVRFEQALAAGEFAEALALYRGDFLDGFYLTGCGEFEQWVDHERLRGRRGAAKAARAQATRAEEAGDLAVATDHLRTARRLAPDDEPLLREFIRQLDRAGDRTGALREYEAFRTYVTVQFGVEPDPETERLVEQVRRATPGIVDRSAVVVRQQVASTTVPVPTAESGIEPRHTGRAVPSGPVPGFFRRIRALRRAAVIGGSFAIAVYLAARGLGIGASGPSRESAAHGRGESIVLVEFENRTADSSIGLTVTEALRVDLSQSRALRLIQPRQVVAALERMHFGVGGTLDPEVAREVAQREGAKAVIVGEVNRAGSAYMLSARLVAAEDGDILTSLRETARDSTELIDTIDRLSAGLRQRIGEPLKAIRASPPLPHVTTPSLEALRKFAGAGREHARANYVAAIQLLKEAVSIDTAFAMAYRALATVIGNSPISQLEVDWSLRREASLKAYEHRDRLTDLERHLVTAWYYHTLQIETPDGPEKALAAYGSALALDPQNSIALTNSADILMYGFHRYEEAEQLVLRAAGISTTYHPFTMALTAQLAQRKLAAAETTVARFAIKMPDHPFLAEMRARLSGAMRDYAEVEAQFRSLLARGDTMWQEFAQQKLAWLYLMRGRATEWESYWNGRMHSAEVREVGEDYLTAAIQLAWTDLALRAFPVAARQKIDAALERFPLNSIPPKPPVVYDMSRGGSGAFSAEPGNLRTYLELAEFFGWAGDSARANRMLTEYRNALPEMAELLEGDHYLMGVAALAGGRTREASKRFREFNNYIVRADVPPACTPCGLYELAWSYDLAGEADSALAIYERAVGTPGGYGLTFSEAKWLAKTYRRLAELHEDRGHLRKAIEYYNRFVSLWQDADPELQPQVAEARRRITRLAAQGSFRP